MLPDPKAAELRRDAMRRGIVLHIFHAHSPYPVTDRAVLMECQTRYPELDFGLLDVQRIMDYLSGHGLAHAENKDRCWAGKITSTGVDYLSGIGDPMPGVNRA
jgi:hypothetical protein